MKTTKATGRYAGLSVAIHSRLTDIDYGDWQGLTPDEARTRLLAMVEIWYRAPHLVLIPGGETLDVLRLRARELLTELVKSHVGQTIALVGHTVINRVILLGILGIGNDRFWHLRQEPCAINVIEAKGDDYKLVSINDTCHLSVMGNALDFLGDSRRRCSSSVIMMDRVNDDSS